MSGNVKRIFVEKKPGMNVEAQSVLADLTGNLGIAGLEEVRLLNRYDIEGISDEEYNVSKTLIFSEPNADNIFDEEFNIPDGAIVFAVEYLPGQYDQRADSAAQCLQILTQKERPIISAAKLYVLIGKGDFLSDEELKKIKNYCINPVESREASLDKPESLKMKLDVPDNVAIMEGFIDLNDDEIAKLRSEMGLAMSAGDLQFCRDYFKDQENRNPTITEIRVIDTYWSDHCRHTTFLTRLNNIKFADDPTSKEIEEIYNKYMEARQFIYGDRCASKDITLMDIATLGTKYLKKSGFVNDLDESDEINACSIVVEAEIGANDSVEGSINQPVKEKWLLMFKNETHNHPTEIEPFGGAATCLGGAIRDPLSGRSYVYQAMRITGAADPTVPVDKTIKGKLPQRKITTGAAAGYSSYGNQIGLATGLVKEIYHPGYMAKRMEIGAVIACAPMENVVRKAPERGDVVILLGGRTGRDGIGGATGSSKEHTVESVTTCGSEVQKGNPPTERKLQRLFRNPQVSTMIKKCNDFGAGGVCVAIGELAPSLIIDLDKVPKKYEGLDGTEIAISESQERMAVVISASDVDSFLEYAATENLEAVKVADITDTGRLNMFWRGIKIVDIKREFLDTNGVKQDADVSVSEFDFDKCNIAVNGADLEEKWKSVITDLNCCSQKGLVERFDSTIGANTVLMPFGGKYQYTPNDGMVAKLAVEKHDTATCSLMAYGFDPYISEKSPFHGAMYAVIESLAGLTAMGGDSSKARLTFQEYFQRLGTDSNNWGKPFSALLGAFHAQLQAGVPSIGGKDSMSGTFESIHVPPTLVSFAVTTENVNNIISPEFKAPGNRLYLYQLPVSQSGMPDFENMKKAYSMIHSLIKEGVIISARTVKAGGLAEAVSGMAFGNKVGCKLVDDLSEKDIFEKKPGSIVFEAVSDITGEYFTFIGQTIAEKSIIACGESLDIDSLLNAWRKPLDPIFPELGKAPSDNICVNINAEQPIRKYKGVKIAKPRVFIPVFPGTNCEYDTVKAFERAGAVANTFIFKNLTAADIEESLAQMAKMIDNSQMIMIPGGFSGGDEPDGSGKFIATAFRNPIIKEAVSNMLNVRDGLMLGICNGFQALIKLGLVPYGEIRALNSNDPTLTFNTIGRHISRMVNTRVASVKSPWLMNANVGDVHSVAISHGEGRFVADEKTLKTLIENGQIATQYADGDGNVAIDPYWNPNGSVMAIEGITSPDGRVLGKMAHSERIGRKVCINVPGNKDQKLFESGVMYFG